MNDPRVVLCDCCSGEGRIYHGDPDTGRIEDCPWCEGTGGEIIETQPVTMEDLAEPAGIEPAEPLGSTV